MKKRTAAFLTIISTLFLAGCSDLIEIQERDFVLALGISCQEEDYILTYALPDLGYESAAGENARLVRTYEGSTFTEIEDTYNRNSERRLDYRHLQVIVLDPAIASDEALFRRFITFMNENNEISRSVLVYYFDGDLDELFLLDETLDGSIGDHIKNLTRNNNQRFDVSPVSTGDFIDGLYSDATLLIPQLHIQNDSIAMDGAAIFSGNQYVETISEDSYSLYYILQGIGKDYTLTLPGNKSVTLKGISSQMSYRYSSGTPYIHVDIEGSAEAPIDTVNTGEINDYLTERLSVEISRYMKDTGIDYLDLHKKSSLKNWTMWKDYENDLTRFAGDALVTIATDITLQ